MDNDRLLTPKELAGRLQVTIATLKRWRYQGTGPEALLIGENSIRYEPATVDAWLVTRSGRTSTKKTSTKAPPKKRPTTAAKATATRKAS